MHTVVITDHVFVAFYWQEAVQDLQRKVTEEACASYRDRCRARP